MKIAYLCDQKDYCSVEAGCSKNGGPCEHTCNIEHAKNFFYEPSEKSHDGEARAMEDPDGSIRKEYSSMDWPEITADTPVEEVVRIHRMIWDYVIEHGYKPETPYHSECAFCEYAKCIDMQQDPSSIGYGEKKCRHCLGDWPKLNPYTKGFFCERFGGLHAKWIRARSKEDKRRAEKLAKQIRDIPIRKDILKGV